MAPPFEGCAGWRRITIDLPGHGKSPVDGCVSGHGRVPGIGLDVMAGIAPGQSFAVAGESRGGEPGRGHGLHAAHCPRPHRPQSAAQGAATRCAARKAFSRCAASLAAVSS